MKPILDVSKDSKDPDGDRKRVAEQVRNAPNATLIPYYLSGVNTPSLYNGVRFIGKDGDFATADSFGIKDIPEQ